LKAVHNQAGVTALAHDLAAEKNKPSEVHFVLKHDTKLYEGSRSTSGDRTRPAALDELAARLKVDPIIRGYSLRHFVEDQTPEVRYAEVAQWLQLTPLVEVQRNLRLLRQQVKADAEDNAPKALIDAQISRATSRIISTWDETAVLAFANGLLSPLDANLKLVVLDRANSGYVTLVERAEEEDKEFGIAGLRQLAVAIGAVYAEEKDEQSGKIEIKGAIAAFEGAVAKKRAAEELEASEKSKAASAIFSKVWTAAEPLFKDGAPPFENCPICDTPIAETTAGSRQGIHDHIRKHQAELAAYAAAKEALDKATNELAATHNSVIANLAVLQPLVPQTAADLLLLVTEYAASIDQWTDGRAPHGTSVKAALLAALAALDSRISDIQKRQGEETYAKALAKIDNLLEIKEQEQLRARTSEELGKLLLALNEQATFVSTEIRKNVQTLLDSLREPTNDLYKSIQGKDAVPIRLELPPEDDTNQQRLSLLIDFSPNRQAVPPSGYLSDSQIHSLALSLRLAAIRTFNSGAPIAILDDIVTSYDADHRRAIAGMIAEELTDLQVIVTTHDQRFFSYLKDQLPPATWSFTQIIRLEREYGPRFSDHKISDEMIEARWADGQSAANEMRQAEEEWLLERCREFGAEIRIREVDRAYSYDRGELALALAMFLKHAGLTPPEVPGVKNRFLASLQKGEVENFGSHFQDGPYGDGSIGDERARWAEFVFFRGHFVCPACNRTRFKRPQALSKPVCAHDRCETQFQFKATTVAA
jgi:hypothetical protein